MHIQRMCASIEFSLLFIRCVLLSFKRESLTEKKKDIMDFYVYYTTTTEIEQKNVQSTNMRFHTAHCPELCTETGFGKKYFLVYI